MKRVAAIAVAVAVFTAAMLLLPSCKGEEDTWATTLAPGQTTNASVYIEEMTQARASLVDKEIGKCEKNKKIVFKKDLVDEDRVLGYEYEVTFLVDDTGNNNYKLLYSFYHTPEEYNAIKAEYSDKDNKRSMKLEKYDDSLLLIVLHSSDNFKVITDRLTSEVIEKGGYDGVDQRAATLYKEATDYLREMEKTGEILDLVE